MSTKTIYIFYFIFTIYLFIYFFGCFIVEKKSKYFNLVWCERDVQFECIWIGLWLREKGVIMTLGKKDERGD